MTGKILSFAAAKRAKQAPKKKPPAEPPKTNQELFEDVYADVMEEWKTHAERNGLNEYIRKKIPVHARGVEDASFVSDLNVLALVEIKLGMKVAMRYPDVDTLGWIVSFCYQEKMFTAPPIMASEAYARALNILLYIELQSRLKKLKRL